MELKEKKNGFTLIEVLLVVAIIGILAAIVIIAINPRKQLGDTNDAKRRADVTTILNGVYQYTIDNHGVIPSTITSTSTEICGTPAATSGQCVLAGLIDLSVLTNSETYLTAIPTDPTASTSTTTLSNGTVTGTGYRILTSSNRRITVSSMAPQSTTTITATR